MMGLHPKADWPSLLAELQERRQIAYAGGGEERRAREHRHGRSTARERIAKLADPGTFLEIGTLVTTPTEDGSPLASTYVCGICEIDGRPVAIGAEDFTVEGGGVGVHLPQYKGGWGGFIEELALGYRIPLVLLMNGVGGSVILQDAIGYPELQASNPTFPMFELLEMVPVVTAVLGPTAGSSAARAHMAHFSVMSEDNGCLFAGGPPVVKQALGQEVDKFTLGGSAVHTRASGLIDNAAPDEDGALNALKSALSYLPDHVGARPARSEAWEENDQEDLLTIVSPNMRKSYDAQALIRCLADADSFFEVGPDHAKSLRTGFARFEGHVAGVLASDCRHMAGSLDATASVKQSRFVETCDRFNVPLVYLVDVPGFLVGPKAEAAGTLKFGAMALRAIQQAKVPVYTVQVRRSFGLGGVATGSTNPMSIRLAWPSAAWGDMPIEGGVEAAFRATLEAAAPEDRARIKKELTERFAAQTSIWKAVENFSAEEMIDPRETRGYLNRLIALYYRRPLTGRAG